MLKDRYLASLVGGALGDALGRPTEFRTQEHAGVDPRALNLPAPALITDDTQMSLAVARALKHLPRGQHAVHSALRTQFLAWLNCNDHAGRAPGMTCMSAMHDAAAGHQGPAQNDSKGAGAIMRAHPVAFLDTPALRRDITINQATLTHGHPTSTLATLVWVEVVHAAATGAPPKQWLPAARTAAADLSGVVGSDVADQEVDAALTDAETLVRVWDDDVDPCTIAGDGWIAEESLAVALSVAAACHDRPRWALQRAAATRGDSDTVASLVGALLGAHHGMDAWPEAWVEAVEPTYRAQIMDVWDTSTWL